MITCPRTGVDPPLYFPTHWSPKSRPRTLLRPPWRTKIPAECQKCTFQWVPGTPPKRPKWPFFRFRGLRGTHLHTQKAGTGTVTHLNPTKTVPNRPNNHPRPILDRPGKSQNFRFLDHFWKKIRVNPGGPSQWKSGFRSPTVFQPPRDNQGTPCWPKTHQYICCHSTFRHIGAQKAGLGPF